MVELIRNGTGARKLLVIDMDTEREMAEKVTHTHTANVYMREKGGMDCVKFNHCIVLISSETLFNILLMECCSNSLSKLVV